MNKILLGIFDEHKLTQEGISSLLRNIDEVEITLWPTLKSQLLGKPETDTSSSADHQSA